MAAFDIATLPYTERLHWQSRKDWLTGRVTHSSFIVVAALWGFGIAWNAITGTIATINREKIATVFATDWTEALAVVAVFGLGVLVVLLAIAATLSWRQNGKSTLVIGTLPAFAGETFSGTIEAGKIVEGRQAYELALTCERVTSVRRRREGSRRSTHHHFHREQLGKVTTRIQGTPMRGPDGLFTFPVTIAVPEYHPGSHHEDDGTGIRWTLHIQSADGQSPVFGAAYEVPIYRREDLELQDAGLMSVGSTES